MNQKQKNKIAEEIEEAFQKKDYEELDLNLKKFSIESYSNDMFSMCCIAGTNLITLLLLSYFLS
jgi:hypothetical protein